MILFKRVNESFRHIEGREWALLFLETFGVIVGILLAFELQEWASRRNEAAKHRQLMERLFEESKLDVGILRDWRENLRDMISAEKKFATEISQGKCPAEADWEGVETLGMMPAIAAPTSVYEELKGAGGLSSVESLPVRVELANFHSQLEWVRGQIEYFRSNRVDVVETSDPRITTKVDFNREEPEYSTYERGALCADHGFRNRVAAATRAHVVYAGYFSAMTDYAISMCATLADSLGTSCAPDKEIGGPLTGPDAEVAAKTLAAWRKKLASQSRPAPSP